MEAVQQRNRPTGLIVAVALVVVIGALWAWIASLPAETPEAGGMSQEEVLYFAQDYLPMVMFLTLAGLLFTGFPVAFILGGLALLYGLIGYFLDVFSLIEFFNFRRVDEIRRCG